MKFLQAMGQVGYSSFYSFEFEYHPQDICNVHCGDQIWTNGHEIEIADYVERENLDYLISLVDNKTAFKGALRRCGLLE